MSAEQRNIEFVKEVEKHPCLYNSGLMDYARKDLTDKAWKAVGDKLNLSGPQCKEKWKNLRTVLARNLRQTSASSPKRRKPYYLLEAMKFTIPFIKSPYIVHAAHYPDSISFDSMGEQQDNAPIDQEDDEMNVQDCITQIKEDDDTTYEPYNRSGTSSPQSRSPKQERFELSPQMYEYLTPSLVMEPDTETETQEETKSRRRKRTRKSTDTVEKDEKQNGHMKSKKAKTDKAKTMDVSKTSRKRFLLSLLSDVYAMNNEQMRSFRIKVLHLIDEIVQTSSSTSKST